MAKRRVVFPENMDTLKGLPYDSGTKKYYVDPSPLVDGSTITVKGSAPNKKITINPRGFNNFVGKALIFNPETNKIDVKHDSTLTVNGSNQLGISGEVLSNLEDKLTDLYNKLKSEDRLLERVEYKQNTKELWFYVGSPQKNGDETILKVNIADLLPVVSTRGISGSGTANNPLDIRIDPASKGAEVTNNGLKITVPEPTVDEDANNVYLTFGDSRVTLPKGLTCEAFGQLPKHVWEDGMSVLAKRSNGQCVQLVPKDSIFQTVGLAATYGKLVNSQETETFNTLTGFVEDTYFINYTISNSGEDTNTSTVFTINQPILEQGILNTTCEIRNRSKVASVSNPVFNAQNGTWTITITGLEKNGQVNILWKGKASTDRSYQVNGSIVVDPTIVNKSTNLTTTHTLNVNTQRNTSVINDSNIGEAGTEACPYINATLDGIPIVGVPYNSNKSGYELTKGVSGVQANYIFNDKYYSNFTPKFTNGKNVVILHQPINSNSSKYYVNNESSIHGLREINMNSITIFGSYVNRLFARNSQLHLQNISLIEHYQSGGIVQTDYSFDSISGNLVIPSPKEGAYYVFVRPESPNCLWQLFVFIFGKLIPTNNLNIPKGTVTGITENEYQRLRYIYKSEYSSVDSKFWSNDIKITSENTQSDEYFSSLINGTNATFKDNDPPFPKNRLDFSKIIGYKSALNPASAYIYTETYELTLKKGKVYDITIDYGYGLYNTHYFTTTNYTQDAFSSKNLTTKGELNIESLTPTKVRITTTNRTTETNDFTSNRLVIRFVD